MSVDTLLSRLERVRKVGPDRWTACCPSHADRSPSLSIRETADGTVLLKCFAGCGVSDILRAIGMNLSELFPATRVRHHGPRIRRPFYPDQVFATLRHEAFVIAIIATDMHASREISEADYQRLGEAISKVERIAEAAYGR